MAGNNNEKYSYQLYEEAGKRMSEGRYELFSDLYSKEYAESAEEHVFHKILQKEKVGYGWTILDALYEENENWYEAITMVYCLERKQKDVAESMGISIQALTGVLYRARKWVKIHYNSDDYTK